MAKGQQRDPAREAKWREVVARHRKSGLSVRAFCEREQLPESAFYAWRRTIQERDGQRAPAQPAFLPVRVRPEDGHDEGEMCPFGEIAVELRGGRVLRLPLSMPPAQLAAIVHAIEANGPITEGWA